MAETLLCKECPRCKDVYPNKVDSNGDHFCICGMGGNKVYPEPRRVKRIKGSGYMRYGAGSCGMYKNVEEALKHMTDPEIKRWESGEARYKGGIEQCNKK